MDVFNTPISRKGTYCTQWDFCEDRFGVKDVLPFSISDMDLPIPEAIIRALRKRLEHPILGYSRWQHDDYLNTPAKAVLMLDVPVSDNNGGLTPEPDDGQDPCGIATCG